MADLVEEGGAERAPEGAGLLREGERRTVTVLFSDMKGFTALSEQSDPEEMDALMTRVFSRFESIIRSRGGSVEKYIGDALVAVFGYPEIHEDDPCRAIEAALEFYASLEREPPVPRLQAKAEEGAPKPQFRTGVHTGLVATGRRGRFDVVTGHTMAIAARLQTAAAPDGILVSDATKGKCEQRFVFGEVQELALKGKDEVVAAWPVLGRKRREAAPAGPFLGRDAELEELVAAYVRSFRSEGGGAYLSGEGGIGKTRLCQEFVARLRKFPNWSPTLLVLNPAQAGEYEYAALASGVLDAMGLEPGIGRAELAAAFAARLGLPEAEARAAAALLRPEHGGRAKAEDAEGEGTGPLLRLLDALLSSDGNMYPDLVLLDNARSLDARSRVFFRRFLSEGRNRPFFLLADRQEDEGLAALFRITQTRRLPPLSDENAARLVRALDPDGADERSVDLVVQRSQGYPLFIEEYVKLLRRDRSVSGVPDTIQNTILASIDRFEPELKSFLQKLSVFRYPFEEATAAELERLADPDSRVEAGEALARLEAEGLLQRREEGRWRFKHAIIKDAVYDSLLNHNKKILHLRAAELLRRRAPERSCDVFWHLASGESWDEAREYLIETRPSLTIDHEPLIQELIEHRPEGDTAAHVELLFQKYAIHFNNRVFAGVEPILAQMYAIALRERSPAFLARVSHLYLTHYLMRQEFEAALHHGERAIELYAQASNARGEANAHHFLAHCRILRGEFAAAREVVESIDRSGPYGSRQYAGARALWHWYHGDYREAAEWNERCAELDAISGKKDCEEEQRFTRVVNVQATFEYAFALSQEAATPPPDWAEPEHLAQYYACRALALGRSGEPARARDLVADAERYALQVGEETARIGYRVLPAWVLRLLGFTEEAQARAEALLPEAARLGNWTAYFELAVLLAELARAGGRLRDAAFFVGEAASLVDRPVLKERRHLLRYRWLAARLAEEAEEELGALGIELDGEGEACEARRLLREELASLRGEAERAELLALSVYGEIAAASGGAGGGGAAACG